MRAVISILANVHDDLACTRRCAKVVTRVTRPVILCISCDDHDVRVKEMETPRGSSCTDTEPGGIGTGTNSVLSHAEVETGVNACFIPAPSVLPCPMPSLAGDGFCAPARLTQDGAVFRTNLSI